MKQKPWELQSHKHPHFKFPRNTKRIKNFEGSLLTHRKIWGWRDWHGGWLQQGQVRGFINQYVGKSYNELLEAWHQKVKHLKARHPYEVSLKNWISKDKHGNYREYYVNDEGIICVDAKYRRKDHHRNYNSKIKLPDFGAVRTSPISNDRYTRIPYAFKGKLSEPIYIGKVYCYIDKQYHLLPAYQCSNLIYHKFKEWWQEMHCDKFNYATHKYGPTPYKPFREWLGNRWSHKFSLADDLERIWMAPEMPGINLEQHHYKWILNPHLPEYSRELFQEMNKEFPNESRIEWLKDRLANYRYIQADFGIGKLCLLVKQEDYINYGKENNKN